MKYSLGLRNNMLYLSLLGVNDVYFLLMSRIFCMDHSLQNSWGLSLSAGHNQQGHWGCYK